MKLYDNIASNLQTHKGINLITGTIYDLQELWLSWYRGNVNEFHYYNAKVNGRTIQKERKTMNMAKKISEDITKLLWSEKTQINLQSKTDTKKIWSVLDSKKNSFTRNFSNFIEKTMALGTGVLIEYKDGNNETIIDYVDGTQVIPYKYTNSYIYGIVTISRSIEQVDKKKIYYTHITYHEYDNGIYTIKHELYKSDIEDTLGEEIDLSVKFDNLQPMQQIETKVPRFQIITPNITNNFDINSPMGISVFANSIDRLKAIDIKYDSFNREFELAKKRILVDPTAMKAQTSVGEDGVPRLVQYFDADDEAFVGVNGMEEQPVKEVDFTIRAEEHITSINQELNWLSANLGLGNNFYKFDRAGLKTATEVISEKDDAFRTRENYLTIIKDAVYDLVYAICEMEGIKATEITIIPDDSIIEDKNTKILRDIQEVSLGLMSKRKYLAKRGLSEKEITEELAQIENEKGSTLDELGFGSEE